MYVNELGGITDMSSYHCLGNVSIEWNKGNQVSRFDRQKKPLKINTIRFLN